MDKSKNSQKEPVQVFESILLNIYSFLKMENAEDLAKNAIEFQQGKVKKLEQDINVRILKGGTYKIKGYYLENDKLTDIRGASSIITEVQEKIVPLILEDKTGYNFVVYNGGGNLFALVPETVDENLPIILEQEAQKHLVTANTAYFLSDSFPLSQILSKQTYRSIVAKKEAELNERKKSKLAFNPAPKSNLIGQTLLGTRVEAKHNDHAGSYCERCKKRIALYKMADGTCLCGGCLHKAIAGKRQKSKYHDEYQKRESIAVCPPKDLKSISEDHIAVIYADGNNMGGIVQNINTITDMMDFSSFVKEAMTDIVFDSIKEIGMKSFEIVALGGDDIFIIVPAKASICLATKLIDKYKTTFFDKFKDKNSTLSVGLCIAKPNTPVKVMLEVAEEELSLAKNLAKTDVNCSGSLSFRTFNTYEGSLFSREDKTLLPYTYEAATQIIKFANKLGDSGDIKTHLQNLSEAFKLSESSLEANMFFNYTNAKSKDNKLELPKISGYTLNGAFYTRNGENDLRFIWDDLLDVLAYGGKSND